MSLGIKEVLMCIRAVPEKENELRLRIDFDGLIDLLSQNGLNPRPQAFYHELIDLILPAYVGQSRTPEIMEELARNILVAAQNCTA